MQQPASVLDMEVVDQSGAENHNYAGEISRSDSKEFLEHWQAGASVSMIGQFCVGFSSAKLVADTVTMPTKQIDDEQCIWESQADGSFTVTGHVNGEQLAYLEESRIKDLVQNVKLGPSMTNYLVVAGDTALAVFCKQDPDNGIDSVAKSRGTNPVSGLKFRNMAATRKDNLQEQFKEEPVAFMGGMFAGLLRLDLNEDPLKDWVSRTVEASGITEEEFDAGGAKPEEESPQQIEIE